MANTEVVRQPVAVKSFFDNVTAARGNDAKLSSDAVTAVVRDSNIKVPTVVQDLLGKFPEEHHPQILDGVLVGSANFKREHGFEPGVDLVETALYNAVRATTKLGDLFIPGIRLDNATNNHHDQLSLQPATALVAILQQISEAIPYAAYLPADVKNNEGRIAILQNLANSDFGEYTSGSSLNGIDSGGAYFDSERVCVLSVNGGAGPFNYTVTQKATMAAGSGVAVAAGNAALPLLRGRTVLVVNGIPAGRETAGYGGGANTIAGSATILGVSYALTGTVNSDTGVIAITSAPALPAGVVLEAYAYIDYEKAPLMAPKVGVQADVYSLFARETRGIVKNTMAAMTQMQAELSLDPRGQALMSVRSQYGAERHYRGNHKMKRIASQLTASWNYDYVAQIAQKDYSQLWMNLAPILSGLSQRMANATVDHGITTLYMTGDLAALCRGLPPSLFESSGIANRPGIYRMGRLFGMYDVYYTPKGLSEDTLLGTSEILCIGRGSSTARNPLVLGDAVPPVFLPLAMGDDMVQGDGFYTRNFTELNPHPMSAQGSALVTVTGMN